MFILYEYVDVLITYIFIYLYLFIYIMKLWIIHIKYIIINKIYYILLYFIKYFIYSLLLLLLILFSWIIISLSIYFTLRKLFFEFISNFLFSQCSGRGRAIVWQNGLGLRICVRAVPLHTQLLFRLSCHLCLCRALCATVCLPVRACMGCVYWVFLLNLAVASRVPHLKRIFNVWINFLLCNFWHFSEERKNVSSASL